METLHFRYQPLNIGDMNSNAFLIKITQIVQMMLSLQKLLICDKRAESESSWDYWNYWTDTEYFKHSFGHGKNILLTNGNFKRMFGTAQQKQFKRWVFGDQKRQQTHVLKNWRDYFVKLLYSPPNKYSSFELNSCSVSFLCIYNHMYSIL